jgi:hypothetical protein
MVDLWPPTSSFPIGNLFLILIMLVSFYQVYIAGVGASFYSLAFASLFLTVLYVLLARWFASHRLAGEVAFVALGASL